MKWMLLPFKRYAEFSGRSRRMEYWMFQLLNILVFSLLFVPLIVDISLTEGGTGDPFDDFGVLGTISFALMGAYFLAALLPGFAVTVRRFHDIGLTGWAYVGLIVAGILPIVGFLASIAVLVITILPGNEGENQYGPDPKNPFEEDIFG